MIVPGCYIAVARLLSQVGACTHLPARSTYGVSLDRMTATLSIVFTPEHKAADAKGLRAGIRRGLGSSSSLNLDDFLSLLLDNYSGRRFVETRAAFSQMLARADANGDGVHSLDEFHALLRAHGVQMDDSRVIRLYRRLTEISGGDTISAHDLALVAEAEGFAVGKQVQPSAQQARTELEGLQAEWQRRQEHLKQEIYDIGKRCADCSMEPCVAMCSRV